MSADQRPPAGNGYQSCQPPNCLYAVDGDSVDWAYGELGAAALHHRGRRQRLPCRCPIDHRHTLWPHNQGALIYQAKIARTPYLLARGPDANSVAATPMTRHRRARPSQLTAHHQLRLDGQHLQPERGRRRILYGHAALGRAAPPRHDRTARSTAPTGRCRPTWPPAG